MDASIFPIVNLYGEADCRHGRFRFPKDYYIGAALDCFGEYSELEVQFLCSMLKSGDVVLEAGAHIGTITVPLAKAVGEAGKIYAFEPQESIHEMLAVNIAANASTNVMLFKSGLGDVARTAWYSANPRNTGGVELREVGEIAAEIIPLDSLNMPKLDLLKVDVEGMELHVFSGAAETIKRCRPIIYFENDRPKQTHAVLDRLFSLGYRIWRHEPFLYNPDNFRGVKDDAWPAVASLNMIAVPEEREPPDQVKGFIEINCGQWAAVCRFGGVGDNLIAAAVLSDLVRRGNRVEVITNRHAGEIFENNPFVSKLSICQDGDQPGDGGKEWQVWFEKRSHEYRGGLFHLSHSVECTLAYVQAQTQFWWPERVRRAFANKSYLELAADIAGCNYDFAPLFYPTEMERRKAIATKAKMGPRVVGWVLCGSRFDKAYPQSAWAVARIIKELGVPVMLVGKPGKDHEIAKIIQRDVEKQNGNLNGLHLAMTVQESADGPAADWPLRRSLAQLLTCDLVIGPDTGSMWACALEAMPKIMLLSHASETNITKHWRNTTTLHADPARVPCWPCHRLHDTPDTCVANKDKTGVACISDISADVLVAAAKEALR